MLQAKAYPYVLKFKRPGGTSRGVLTEKESWMLEVWDTENPEVVGVGECGILRGLSADDRGGYEEKVKEVAQRIHEPLADLYEALREWPSIQFGLEMSLRDLELGGKHVFYPGAFTEGKMGIPINGLIWMGTQDFMLEQIEAKLAQGFSCLKMKIGAIDFEKELECLEFIRQQKSKQEIELRVDANGAFTPENALEKLTALAQFDLHSIEQPIKAGQPEAMRELCAKTPLPIALDEELIGVFQAEEKGKLLDEIQPQYVIFKPSFIGGFKGTQEWIDAANARNMGWWITSALESNVGLNAIAQYTATLGVEMPQGLGTGGLFTNNIDRPLEIQNGQLFYKA
ncbi:MAG: o-succinylbenzoate synthase [Crocinitomicaceae bacterium]|nr:o-succinylbenzoate synthase [Crocinitomicaceae bacterium]